jgi:hypothetical protein
MDGKRYAVFIGLLECAWGEEVEQEYNTGIFRTSFNFISSGVRFLRFGAEFGFLRTPKDVSMVKTRETCGEASQKKRS